MNLIAKLTALCCVIAAPAALGAVFITEVMNNPMDAGGMPDSTHQFVEIYNSGASPINIQNWTIEDSGASPSTITASSFFVSAGAFVVLGNIDRLTFNAAYNVALSPAEYINMAGSLPSYGLGSDDVTIEDSGAVTMATISYQNGAGGWPSGSEGSSISFALDPTTAGATDYQVAANWLLHTNGALVSTLNDGPGASSPGYLALTPEPGRFMLAFIALMGCLLKRRR